MRHQNHTKSSLESIRQQFENWRAARKSKKEPIPEHLLNAAAELCQYNPISHVCKQLRLSHSSLKKRLNKEEPINQDFWEIDLSTAISSWQIDCVRSDGSRLSMSGQGQQPNITDILGTFLS